MLKGTWLKLALGAVAVASGPLALWAWNNGMGTGGFSSPVGGGSWFSTRPGFFEARGVQDPELSANGRVYNWTKNEATLRFARLERSRPATIVLRIQGMKPISGPQPEITFSLDGVEAARLEVPTAPTRVTLEVPKRAGRGLLLSAKVEGGMGVMVENVRLLPVAGLTVPVPAEALGALAFVALAAYLVMLLASAPPWVALVVACGQATLLAWLSLTGGAFLGRYSERLVWITTFFVLFAFAAARRKDPIWRRAWIAVLWVAALKLCVLGHPQIADADAAFHTGNLRRVVSGDWFFTSATPPPAIAFPYPPGLSFAARPFSRLPEDQWVTLLRVLVILTETICGFGFALMVAALSSETVGALTFVLLALSPEGIAILFVGNLANLFSDALMILGCALLAAKRPMAAAVSLLFGFLSHFGTLLLGAPLAFLLAMSQGEMTAGSLRRTAPVLGALLASFLLYYHRFLTVVADAWDRLAYVKGAGAVGPMNAGVAEKIERMGGGEGWWITALFVTMLAIGMATWPKERKALARILFVWLLVIVGFALLGLVTPVQVRSGLSARPALAAISASGLVALWSRGGGGRALGALLVFLTAVACWVTAMGFLPVKPS